jgi:hypothetical protein
MVDKKLLKEQSPSLVMEPKKLIRKILMAPIKKNILLLGAKNNIKRNIIKVRLRLRTILIQNNKIKTKIKIIQLIPILQVAHHTPLKTKEALITPQQEHQKHHNQQKHQEQPHQHHTTAPKKSTTPMVPKPLIPPHLHPTILTAHTQQNQKQKSTQ